MLWGWCIKVWNLATTWKNKTKNIKMRQMLVKNSKLRVWCSLFNFFHVICKISNFNMWTAKHLSKSSCTELTLCYLKDAAVLEHLQQHLEVVDPKSRILKHLWFQLKAFAGLQLKLNIALFLAQSLYPTYQIPVKNVRHIY